jgi:hypothetical protein
MRIFGAAVLGRTFYDRLPAARLLSFLAQHAAA